MELELELERAQRAVDERRAQNAGAHLMMQQPTDNMLADPHMSAIQQMPQIEQVALEFGGVSG